MSRPSWTYAGMQRQRGPRHRKTFCVSCAGVGTPLMRLSGWVPHRKRTFMTNGNRVSRGDRNRDARLARLRKLVPFENTIVSIDLADRSR